MKSRGLYAYVLPTIVLMLVVLGSERAIAQQEALLRAIDHDHPEHGVKGTIQINELGYFRSVGITDQQGYFEYPEECNRQRVLLRVVPKSEMYYPTRHYCPLEGNVVRLNQVRYVANLEINAEKLVEAGKFADASMVYSELSSRLNLVDPKRAHEFELASYRAAAHWLDIDNTRVLSFDSTQDREVASEELIAEVEAFQLRAGVTETGILNYATYHVASERPISEYIFTLYVSSAGTDQQP